MKLELEKNREQQIPALNGCHGEISAHGSSMGPVAHSVEYALADNFEIETEPQAAVLHLQSAEELDCQGEEEEEEEEDGSSFCSGVTDSSTQSLAPSESEEEEEAILLAEVEDREAEAKKAAEIAARQFHTIKSGDTLGALAVRYHTTVRQLCAWTGIKQTTTLRIGQRLRVH